ncbi:MAG: hypothetical protein ABFE07_23005 [Armatimonadia bacterium]
MSGVDMGALKAALLKVEGNRPDSLGISTQWHRNPEGPQAWAVIEAAQAEIAALRAELAAARVALKDPHAVHVNLLRGDIAQPSIAQIVHIYGRQALLNHLQGF